MTIWERSFRQRENNGKVIAIGDDKQLPPSSHDYVATSLFRSILYHSNSTMLKKEYRFNQDILDLINHYYDNQLVADYSVQDISTADIAKKDYDGIIITFEKCHSIYLEFRPRQQFSSFILVNGSYQLLFNNFNCIHFGNIIICGG